MKDINAETLQKCVEEQKLVLALNEVDNYLQDLQEKYPTLVSFIVDISKASVFVDIPALSKLVLSGKLNPDDVSMEFYKIFYTDMLMIVKLLDKANSESEVTTNDNKG